MKIKILKFIVVFFVSINIFALPGMSTVSYDFTLNSEIFSQTAINCQNNVKADFALQNISEFMGKMNCNNLKETRLFCNCVNSISNSGLSISKKDEEAVYRVIEEESEKQIIESMSIKLKKYEDYSDLIKVLGSDYKNVSCFDDSVSDDIFGAVNKKVENNKPLTFKENIKYSLLQKIKKDIKAESINPDRLSKFEMMSNAKNIKKLADLHYGRRGFSNENSSLVPFSIQENGWKFIGPDSAFKRLLKKNDNLGSSLADLQNVFVHSPLTFSKNTFLSNSSGLLPILNPSQVSGESTLKTASSLPLPYSGDGNEGDSIVDSTIRRACEKFKSELDRDLNKFSPHQAKQSIKAAILNPDSPEKMRIYKLIESKLADGISSEKNPAKKKKLQEFSFNNDILFCKSKHKSRRALENTSSLEKVSKLKDELASVTEKYELAKKEANDKYDKVSKAESKLKFAKDNLIKLRLRVELFQDLDDGKFLIRKNGKVYFDVNNDELLSRYKAIDEAMYLKLKSMKNSGTLFEANEEQFTNSLLGVEARLDKDSKIYSSISDDVKSLKKEHELSVDLLEVIGREKFRIENQLVSLAGVGYASGVISDIQEDIVNNLGVKNDYEMIFETETLAEGKVRTREKILQNIADNSIDNEVFDKNYETVAPASDTNMPDDVPNVSIVDQKTNSIATPDSNIFNTGYSSFDINTNQVNNINSKDQVQESSTNSDSSGSSSSRERELEEKIAQLEALSAKNSISQTDDNSSSSIDSQISELKEKIELEKIKAEKAKVTSQIKQLNSTVSVASDTSSNISNSPTTKYRQQLSTGTKSSRAPTVNSQGSTSSVVSSSSTSSSATSSSAQQPSTTESSSSQNREPASLDGSNYEKSKALTLTGGSTTAYESGLEISSYNPEDRSLNARVVKVDFDLATINNEKQEQIIEALFKDGEDQIIVETSEGKKIIVKSKHDKIKVIETEEDIKKKRKQIKMRHQNLIDLLKVGQTRDDLQ